MNLKILSLVIIGVCILLPDVCYAFLSKDVHLLNMQNGLADNTVSAVCALHMQDTPRKLFK